MIKPKKAHIKVIGIKITAKVINKINQELAPSLKKQAIIITLIIIKKIHE